MINLWFVVIGLVALYALWTFGFKSLFIDNYRERLFSLRLELVGLVREGKLRPTDPAYGQIRLLLNGLIRYAHRVTFTRFIHTSFWTNLRKQEKSNQEADPSQMIQVSIDKLPEETRIELGKILIRMHRETAMLMILTSGLLKALLVIHFFMKAFQIGEDHHRMERTVASAQRDAYWAAESDKRDLLLV